MKELWEEVPNYPNYMVSNLGNIFNIQRKTEITQHPTQHRNGLKVVLYHNNRQRVFQVHRLVASIFLPDYEEDRIVKHRDGNWENNAVWNLEMDPKRVKRLRYV